MLETKKLLKCSRGLVLREIISTTQIDKILCEGFVLIEFKGLQTIMITPHEVYSGEFFDSDDNIYDMGKSKWFKSMNDMHLKNCTHFKIFLCDEIIDVICEDVIVEKVKP